MQCFVILLFLSAAVTTWAGYTGSASNYGLGVGLGIGLASAVHFKPTYSMYKPYYDNSWKPIYKPYTGHGSAYGYGYRPNYASSKPYYTYRPYYGYKPYYGYGSNNLYGHNPYYYGSYQHGLGNGYGYDYIDW